MVSFLFELPSHRYVRKRGCFLSLEEQAETGTGTWLAYNFPCSCGGTLPNRTESAVGELSIRPVQQLPRPSLHTATEEALVGLETNRVWLLLTCRSQICTSTARRPEAILLQRLVNTITK